MFNFTGKSGDKFRIKPLGIFKYLAEVKMESTDFWMPIGRRGTPWGALAKAIQVDREIKTAMRKFDPWISLGVVETYRKQSPAQKKAGRRLMHDLRRF